MTGHVSCRTCHVTKESPPRAVPEACDGCHTKGTGKVMISLWQGTTRKLLEAGISRFDNAAKAQSDSPSDASAARARLDAVRRDGSWGVHNKTMTDLLLQEADRLLGEIAPQPSTKETPHE